MAFNITSTLTQGADFVPVKTVQVTDATASTTTQGDLGAALFKHFRAHVYVTTLTAPDGNTAASAGTSFGLEVSNSSNFDAANADVFLLDTFYVAANEATASGKASFVLAGTVPVPTSYRYVRIKVAAGTNGAVNYDAVIDAA